jgi:succinoglycan biosynthesis transport protein ExoP
MNTLLAPGAGSDKALQHVGRVKGGREDQIRKILIAIRRRIWLIMAVGFVVFALIFLMSMSATPKYTATASIILDPRKEQVTNVTQVLSGLPAESNVVDTEVEVLRSRQLANRVVAKLKLDQDPEFNAALRPPGLKRRVLGMITGRKDTKTPTASDRALQHELVINAVENGFKVSRSGLTYVINASFTSEEPAKAALIANTFADRYMLAQYEAKFDATKQANDWLNEQLGGLRDQVQEAEAAVEQYRSANGLLSASGATLTEQEISSYNQADSTARAQVAEAEAALSTARQQLARGSTGEDVGEALDSPVIQDLRKKRADLTARMADVQVRYGPRHPDTIKVQTELTDINSQIQSEIQRIVSNLEARVQVSRNRAGSIRGDLSNARGVLVSNNTASVRLRELERHADAVRSLYESFLKRFTETSSGSSVAQTDARVISKAEIPTGASSPNLALNLAIGLMLGAIAGAFAAYIAEYMTAGLSTADEVERELEAPYLGFIPLLASVARNKTATPIDYIVDDPLSVYAEAFRNLRAAIDESRTDLRVKVIAITSSLPGEGKTTTAIALGRSLANASENVVIVDCDLRRRGVSKVLKMDAEVGLVEVLNGSAKLEEALKVDSSGVMILPASRTGMPVKGQFNGSAVDDLFAELRERFDYVLIDTPPVLAVADARILAPRADAVVFLAQWRKTPEKAIRTALKVLAGSGAYLSGVALTQMDLKQQSRFGYGDPSYYYGDYKSYLS